MMIENMKYPIPISFSFRGWIAPFPNIVKRLALCVLPFKFVMHGYRV